VLVVVHAYREDHHGEEIFRIISARAAEAGHQRHPGEFDGSGTGAPQR
jgi:hypothetical protein